VLAAGRSRRAGAGCPGAEDKRPGLTGALRALLEEGKRGDPMAEITWSTLSLRDIARQMAAAIAAYQAAGDPVISTGTKKKEQPGAYWRAGESWRPRGDPVQVMDHDFTGPDTVRITPCGICGITANRGFVPAGTSHDTAASAVNAIGLRWQEEGQFRYPGARRLLITCDCGGSSAVPGPAAEGSARRPGGAHRAADRGLPLPARHAEAE
jgi:Rhodopirellula transposase DDE domain